MHLSLGGKAFKERDGNEEGLETLLGVQRQQCPHKESLSAPAGLLPRGGGSSLMQNKRPDSDTRSSVVYTCASDELSIHSGRSAD